MGHRRGKGEQGAQFVLRVHTVTPSLLTSYVYLVKDMDGGGVPRELAGAAGRGEHLPASWPVGITLDPT